MTIDQCRAHIGDTVNYHPPGAPVGSTEEGKIISVTDRWVYVRYGTRRAAEATDPADLELLTGGNEDG